MKELLYIIGAPGAGKTTLVEGALKGCPSVLEMEPFAVRWYPSFRHPDKGVQLGRARPAFGGTDTLSMSIHPKVLDWLSCAFSTCVLGEGDRLTSGSFFDAVLRQGWELTVVHLDTPPDLTALRCEERGSDQSQKWMEGRRTKVERLKKYVHPNWRLDGSLPPEELVERLRQHNVIRRIRAACGAD